MILALSIGMKVLCLKHVIQHMMWVPRDPNQDYRRTCGKGQHLTQALLAWLTSPSISS